jgi:flagellar motor switch protein FliN/FliY
MRLGSAHKMKVPAQVVLGSVELTLDSLASLGEGSVVELDRRASEPVDFIVSGELVARGEVVVVDEKLGIRITRLVAAERRP